MPRLTIKELKELKVNDIVYVKLIQTSSINYEGKIKIYKKTQEILYFKIYEDSHLLSNSEICYHYNQGNSAAISFYRSLSKYEYINV